jgi:perosamine synthetase
MTEQTSFIPVAAPDLSALEEEYVLDAVRSSWISSSGPYIDRFETEFAELCATTSAVGVCNGTIALHLALLALDVRPGDEVLVPSLTYIATANAVRYVGAEPVFVDVSPETWCIDPDALEDRITSRTRGIVAVHLYGHPADMDSINRVAAIHGLWVVEDAAEAHLAKYKDRPVGGLGTIGTFSFYGNKVFSSGEGGALTLSDPQLSLRIRTLRGQGVDPTRRYFFPVTGYNFRITNVACALLCAQLARATEIIERRWEIYHQYDELLSGIPGLGFQPVADWANRTPWLYCITIDSDAFGTSRDGLAQQLERAGIDSRPFFIPLHTLPPFREASRGRSDHLPITERLASSGLNLPTHASLTEEDLARIVRAIRAAQ